MSETERQGSALLRARFVVTICAGSFLLFLVQPMIARMALPRLGGAPSVWNSAMLVYQALLLAGYAYADWLGRLAPRQQAMMHGAVLLLAALTLPIGLVAGTPSASANPALWVLWLLVASIGPLFFAVAAQAPLMQRWFVAAGGGDPYPLYAASNLGSFAGLLAYPLVVEPLLPVRGQSWLWSGGYALLILLVLVCAAALPRHAASRKAAVPAAPLPSLRQSARWIILAAVPSGLMLSTSLHLTTDIVAMPLLWVIPLGLYLLSFSVAFAPGGKLAEGLATISPLFLLMGACTTFSEPTGYTIVIAGVTLITLFVVSVALHRKLYELRPAPEHLTSFYLAMSVGGVIGGLFCALLAPLLFDWTYEHPILLAASGFLIVREPLFAWAARLWESRPRAPLVTAALLIVGLVASLVGEGVLLVPPSTAIKSVCFLIIITIAICGIGNRLLFAGAMVYLMLCLDGWSKLALSATPGAMERSYFGVYAVRDNGPNAHILVHGTTLHGVQNRKPGTETWPTSYYAPLSGVGLAMRAAPTLFGPQARIGVVGLGAGTLACYIQPGQRWRFYEIDPAIAAIARNPRDFLFLSRCQPHADIAIGDARIVLGTEPSNSADLLAIDAFSSDSVPMHLLTKEAFALYARHLAPNGLLLVHISNRYLDLRPVVAAAAAQGGWKAALRHYTPDRVDADRNYSASIWIALSRDPATLARLETADPGLWQPLEAKAGFSPWTDDYGSILSILKL